MSWSNIKTAIDAVIKANNNQEITGPVLNSVLKLIIDTIGAHATYMGIAHPSTNPGIHDGPVFYFAKEAGTYTNFGGAVIVEGLSILLWDGSTWVVTNIIKSVIDTYNTSNADLDIADDKGNVLARFAGGHIRTKNFSSADFGALISNEEMDEVLDGEVAVYLIDIDGNAVLDEEGKPIEII